MTYEELKHHFNLFKCPNKETDFEFGKLIGTWQIASDKWSTVDTRSQSIRTEIIALTSSENTDGIKHYSFTFFKFKVVWGFLK